MPIVIDVSGLATRLLRKKPRLEEAGASAQFMSDAVVLEPLAKLARQVGWTVIAQQPWPMQNLDLAQT